MGRRRREDPEGNEEDFARAMRDVERVGGGPGRVTARPRRPRPAAPASRPVRFAVERWGERVEGLAAGTDRRHLRRLARGELPAEGCPEVDLHGLRAAEARTAVRGAIEQARRKGLRCLRVIHGRGLSSDGPAVLREALPGWLAEPPLASWVLAFTSAPPRLGGTGSLLVLLRRPKQAQRGES